MIGRFLYGVFILMVALIVSGIAVYFSVIGLAAMFAAAFIPIVIMGTSLEVGKIVAAHWLKLNWYNKEVSWLLKTYLLSSVLVLMLITSLGVYGFLSKSHLDQGVPSKAIELQIQQKEAQIVRLQEQNKNVDERIQQLDAGFLKLLDGKNTTRAAINERNAQAKTRTELSNQIDSNLTEIHKINESLIPLRIEINGVEAKLGPIKYLASLLNLERSDSAIQVVIFLLIFAFDPLAIALLFAATSTLRSMKRQKAEAMPVMVQETEAFHPIGQALSTPSIIRKPRQLRRGSGLSLRRSNKPKINKENKQDIVKPVVVSPEPVTESFKDEYTDTVHVPLKAQLIEDTPIINNKDNKRPKWLDRGSKRL